MNRVEAIFQAQRELHMGYRAVLKEIHDLQLKRQAQEHLGTPGLGRPPS